MIDESRPSLPVSVVHSGSTNSPGFEMTVYESGRVECMRWSKRPPGPETPRGTVMTTTVVPYELASRFFRDLREALPLSQYEDKRCFKSASFGFTLRIRYRGEQSPDLACPVSDPRLLALVRDVHDIEQLLS